jgi:hypothetical protein
MRRPLIAALTAAALAGCGDDPGPAASSTPTPAATATATPTPPAAAAAAASSPQARPVAAVLRRYAAAVRAGDARTICRDLLASSVVQRVEGVGGNCARDLIGPRIEEGGPDYAIAVRSISVDGVRAVAQITARERDGSRDSHQPLVREGGGWRLAAG